MHTDQAGRSAASPAAAVSVLVGTMAKAQTADKHRPAPHSPLRNVTEKGQPALYYQLADVCRRRIQDGVWQVGSQIPTLEELVAQFGAARATVRQALTILESEGLL